MIALPLPFVVALLLAMLAARQEMRARETGSGDPARSLFLAMAALSSCVVGLRWGYGWEPARFLQPVVAATLPPLAGACHAGFIRGHRLSGANLILHATPVALVALLVVFWRPPIDAVLILLYAGYGLALVRTARLGPDALGAATLESAGDASRSARIVGWLLVAGAVVELGVALDFRLSGGSHAGAIVALADLGLILVAALVMTLSGGRAPAETAEDIAPAPAPEAGPVDATDDDIRVLAALEEAMTTRRVFTDPDLTLDRLARRLRIPARRISEAVNRATGDNVSAYVNGYRIAEARRLLAETDRPVTSIMFDAGFQTKSNFNRAFREIAGASPRDYRRQHQRGGSDA